MGFKSISEETTKVEAANVTFELQSKSNEVISQLDPFLLADFSLAIEQAYRLEITDNVTGKNTTYRLRDALINLDALVSTNILPLKLEVEIDGKTDTLVFNISETDADRSYVSRENPKYYIYCDNSDKIGYKFWFLKNK
ncbi:hypothetical protein OM416_19595 [Paenibacillus sp. LS1]|uniref:hypothetical protein n=1 Tax=Paenibacillus sp. LS1 TaxID=2992120 RepID=UPI0022314B35|nr:hypothetical protein [Paenibacillus sp. LS1]MCW3793800.1 hypothetical protein [Paenibacillus sp. LS1]